MESKKFRVVTDTDENGKPVRKFVPCDEGLIGVIDPAYAVYGDYLRTDKEHIQQAKDALVESLFHVLRELAKNDDFWIVKELNENTSTVGWKIHIPQMDK